jgi:hypothetical protein
MHENPTPALRPADRVAARRPAPIGRAWSRRTRLVLLLTHILTSVGWWGAAVAVAVFAATAAMAGDPVLAQALHRSIGVALWVTVVAGLASATSGVLLGLGTKWGLIRYRWVILKELITAVMIITDLTVVRTGVADALAGGAAPAELIGPTMGHVVFLAVATVLSVFKPWSRPRRAAAVPAAAA